MNGPAARAFRDWIAARFGLSFDDTRLAWLAEILSRRAGEGDLDRYVQGLARDAAEGLAEDLTVGETYFFRNGAHFDALREHVLPERLRSVGTPQISILSAGCSSGEEPYSLAMLLRETLPAEARIAIRAVDLNPTALAKAAAGRYGQWSLRETSPERLARWFKPRRQEMELDPAIRTMVTFDPGNLADPKAAFWQAEAYDIIFCRNVIMYFTPQEQRAVVARIARALKPNGYLFLGHAESLRSLSHSFHLVHVNGTFCYRRREPTEAQTVATEHPPREEFASTPSDDWYQAIAAASDRVSQLGTELDTVAMGAPPSSPANIAPDIAGLIGKERFTEAGERLAALHPAIADTPQMETLAALVFLHTGRLMAATEACRRILARDELDAGANYILGLCLEEAGEIATALQQYETAIHLDPSFAMPTLRRGLLARRLGHAEDARADLEHARELIAAEEAERLQLFGGGFSRATLMQLCASEIANIGRAA